MTRHDPEVEAKLETLGIAQAVGLLYYIIGGMGGDKRFARVLKRGLSDKDIMERQQPHKQMDRSEGAFDEQEWLRTGGGR